MKLVDLGGEWLLSRDGGEPVKGKLPGCTYLDYMASGMEDPFWGENETAANELARHDYAYSRSFDLDATILQHRHLELVIDGADTLCEINLNGQRLGSIDNINRTWRFDVKSICRFLDNTIELNFINPYTAIEVMQESDPLPSPMMPEPGVGHLRKTPCHFGWDWGPKLPPAGIARYIRLEAYDARIGDVRIDQKHGEGRVSLEVTALPEGFDQSAATGQYENIIGELTLTTPKGNAATHTANCTDGMFNWHIDIDDPELWWCNGLGEQPLYGIEIKIKRGTVTLDTAKKQIGLRTIRLDTSPDEHGEQFRFIINGVPIFAKGANWIPPDSFITRADRETKEFYIRAAKRANMNMLRIWGGGMYEDENFYDACDKYGILVWQDFIFACNPYPVYDEAFLDNVRAEVEDNVKRLRHRASLALWCGNNEIEFFLFMWRKNKKMKEYIPPFFHKTLRKWTDELDGVTPYWPGSPSSGVMGRRPHNMKKGEITGDSHLWQIWHGMRRIEAFRKYPTRFCSEYGMESMPSMLAIRSFTDKEELDLFDPVMQLHQKCPSGNAKMLYYLLAKYRNPAKFEDFVYLSQIVQADTIRFSTDCWRRNIGLQNGAIFWQMNDCWPVASWAGVDYAKQLKAVMYRARHFNKMFCISNDYYGNRCELYVVNEYPHDVRGSFEWTLKDFSGEVLNSGSVDKTIAPISSERAALLIYEDILKGKSKKKAVMHARFVSDGEVLDEKNWLLVPDKKAKLPKAKIEYSCKAEGSTAYVTLTAAVFARFVYVEADGVTAPWSDNFFDIPAGESVTVSVELPPDMSISELENNLKIKSLSDVEPKNGRMKDKWLRFKIFMEKGNFVSAMIFRLI